MRIERYSFEVTDFNFLEIEERTQLTVCFVGGQPPAGLKVGQGLLAHRA